MGFLIAQGMTAYIAERMKSDLYRVPMVMEGSSYGFAAAHARVSAAQLLSGLAEGETVILHPGDTVEEGKKVRAR